MGKKKSKKWTSSVAMKRNCRLRITLWKQPKAICLIVFVKNNVDTDSCGALKKYFYFDENVKKAEAAIELITTEQHDGKGYVWVKYSANYYDANNNLVMGMGETYSRWDIEEKDGTWVVIAIDEMA